MDSNSPFLKNILTSGSLSGLAVSLVAALAGKRESQSFAAPLNATSHILWGDEAATHDRASMKYTGTGFLINQAAAIMWAAVNEKWMQPAVNRWFAQRPALAPLAPVVSGAAVSAGAYITDYYLIPKRFTPGYEKRVSPRSMALIFGAMALGLAASTLLQERRTA